MYGYYMIHLFPVEILHSVILLKFDLKDKGYSGVSWIFKAPGDCNFCFLLFVSKIFRSKKHEGSSLKVYLNYPIEFNRL